MPLQTIDKDAPPLVFSTSANEGSRTTDHSDSQGLAKDDNSSIFSHSTNSTASNLIGTGRVLGNLYSFTGKRLEKTLGDIAHRAGFGPEAIYHTVRALYSESRKRDKKKVSALQKLCFKLFEHTNSAVYSTRITAITRWGDLLQGHPEIFALLFCSGRNDLDVHINNFRRGTKDLREATNSTSDLMVIDQTSSLLECHLKGLYLLCIGRGELYLHDNEFRVAWKDTSDISGEALMEWNDSFLFFTDSLSNPRIYEITHFYLRLWSSHLESGDLNAQVALQSCRSLRSILEAQKFTRIDEQSMIQNLCEALHKHYIQRFFSATLLGEEDDAVSYSDSSVYIPNINGLARSFNTIFTLNLEFIPEIHDSVIPGSTSIGPAGFKEKLIFLINTLESKNGGIEKRDLELLLLRACKKIMNRALSELELDLLNDTRDSKSGTASLQFGDILHFVPEVYKFLVTLGGDETRACLLTFSWSLKTNIQRPLLPDSVPWPFTELRQLLECHATGLAFLTTARESDIEDFDGKMNRFFSLSLSKPSYPVLAFLDYLKPLMTYLTDEVTFIPSVYYLKGWISQFDDVLSSSHQTLQFCAELQNVLTSEFEIKAEHRNIIKELQKRVRKLLSLHLPTIGKLTEIESIRVLGCEARSVYEELANPEMNFEEVKKENYVKDLLQLCNLLFKNTESGDWAIRIAALQSLSELMIFKNFVGWFLSSRGRGAEECTNSLLLVVNFVLTDGLHFVHDLKPIIEARRHLLQIRLHECGVNLLAPRLEKLHLSGTGLKQQISPTLSTGLTPEQKKRWLDAFKALMNNLGNPDVMHISLFYLSNCTLPPEGLLDNSTVLEYFELLRVILTDSQRLELADKEDISGAIYHFHTCLTQRVQFVQRICKVMGTDVDSTFKDTPFSIPTIIKILKELETLSEEKLAPSDRLVIHSHRSEFIVLSRYILCRRDAMSD